ncbi:hypothetical protein [Gordonia bronchialis]|uniref:hypothetical protein n=1 Tax=Gordonia bronchialis TaxID=2054 RepID=UPI002271220F|nr:hypothetical protein [Gordonia bronchialis]
MTFTGSTVRYEARYHRAYLTLDRPDRLNAITAQMAQEISAAVATTKRRRRRTGDRRARRRPRILRPV